MAKKLIVLTSLASAVFLSGCANVAGEVSRRTDAPPWFKQRVKEIEGEGYPSFSEANKPRRPLKSEAEWAEVKSDLETAKASVNADPRAVDPGVVRNSMEWQAAAKESTGAAGVER